MIDILKDLMVMLRGMWKYKWLMIVSAWVIAILGWTAVFAMPNQYAANARVYLDTSSRLRDVVRSLGMEPNVDSRVFLVRQAMLGRPQLEAVARQTDLDLRATTDEKMEQLILGLQEKVTLRSGRTRESENLFQIAYTDYDRDMSLAVVEALLNNFVENVLSSKDEDTLQARNFLDGQLNHYRKELKDTELELEVFKREHPQFVQNDKGDGYYERLQNEQAQKQSFERLLNVELRKRSELKRQLAGSNPYTSEPNSADGVSVAIPGNQTSARIQSLQEQRRDLLLSYTERHPDVVAMNDQIGSLKKQLKAELAAIAAASNGDGAAAANNPVYVEVQIQLSAANLQIASIRGQISESDKTIRSLESVLDLAPELDREYTELIRDYDKFAGLYAEVFERAERERIGRVGEQQDVVTFNVIDPPVASLEPVSPPRPLLLFGVLLFAIGSGAGAGFVAYQLKPSFSDTATLQELTGVNVLGRVAYAFPQAAKVGKRKDVAGFTLAIGGLFVLFMVAVSLVDTVTPLVQGFLRGGAA